MPQSRLALLLSCLFAGAPVFADDAAQQAEIDLLKQQVRDLQVRMERLEAGQAETAALVESSSTDLQPVPGGWRSAHNWQLLETGMEKHEVRAILGEPADTRKISKFVHWSYGDDGLLRFYFGRLKSWEQASAAQP